MGTVTTFPRRLRSWASAPDPVTPPPPAPAAGSFTLHLTFAAPPTGVSLAKAPTKYNKPRILQLDFDDGGADLYQVVRPLFRALTYDDGTGRAIPFRANAAIVRFGSSGFSWAQFKQMVVENGFDGSDHTYYDQDANYAQDLALLRALTKTELEGLGLVGYESRTFIVPTNWPGYVEEEFSPRINALLGTSQGTAGTYPLFPPYQEIIPVVLAQLPAFPARFVLRRFNLDRLTASSAAEAKGIIDSLLSGADSERKLMRFFCHSATPTLFEEVFRYAHAQAAGRVWMPTLREFAEYREVVARTVIGAGTVSGNTLSVPIDQSSLPAACRWRDLSLLVSGGTLSEVSISGGLTGTTVTKNATTGLVNIYCNTVRGS